MEAFFLHGGEREALELQSRLRLPGGAELPARWTGSAVLGWGARRPEAGGCRFTLQPVRAVQRALRRTEREAVLRLNGIKTAASHGAAGNAGPYPYQYQVAVCHLQVLAVYEKKTPFLPLQPQAFAGSADPRSATAAPITPISADYCEVLPEAATYHVRRASREAVKAIYALGLDYGLVTLGVLASGHTLVLRVDPTPRLDERLAALFAEALERCAAGLERELQRAERAVLGCDPEFLLLSPQGKVVPASRFLQREGPVGCDAIVQSGQRIVLPLAELRPQPSDDPRELARNLHRTMQLAARVIPDESLAWLSGGMPLQGFPLGGHIHFSRCGLNTSLLRALDNYLALPLVQIEDATTQRRRPRYGVLGDFRRQSHGGFEYRTLPSWLASPAVARGIFALAALIADNYWLLTQRPLEETAILQAYYCGDKARLQHAAAAVWSGLEQLPAYEQYAELLAPLKSRVARMQSWEELHDFRKAWKIGPFRRKEAIKG